MPTTAMLVVTRYRVPHSDFDTFLQQARDALAVLADRPGWLGGHIGRAIDDSSAWVLTTEWVDVGSYRRALSAYEVKLTAVPLLSLAVDEPTAFEVLTGSDESALADDAATVGIGESGPPRTSGSPGTSGPMAGEA